MLHLLSRSQPLLVRFTLVRLLMGRTRPDRRRSQFGPTWTVAVSTKQPYSVPHERPPRRGERTGCRYANLNFSEPSFSIVLTISSSAFSHTCFSLGYPRMTPWGVPDQMMSPGSSVHILVM